MQTTYQWKVSPGGDNSRGGRRFLPLHTVARCGKSARRWFDCSPHRDPLVTRGQIVGPSFFCTDRQSRRVVRSRWYAGVADDRPQNQCATIAIKAWQQSC